MSHNSVLIVHPDASVRSLMTSMLQTIGHPIEEVPSDRAALRLLERGGVGAVLASGDGNPADTVEFLSYMRRKHGGVPVIVVANHLTADRQREASQWGASAVLRFPLPATQLRAAVSQAIGPIAAIAPRTAPASPSISAAAVPPEASRPSLATVRPAPSGSSLPSMVGDDPLFRQAIELAESVAATRTPVLIVGQHGTGKHLLARTLHSKSSRRDAPCIEVNCAAGNESALEVELFGQRGIGGVPDREGKLSQAHGGTLYLSEVAALSPGLQYKLLRVLQEGQFEPLGSTQTVRVDVRLVAATRENLAALVDRGAFRQDLFYRISVVVLNLPALRQRGEDILRLADHFRSRFARSLGRPALVISPEAAELLRRYNWPGNVLELENTIERAVLLSHGPRIESGHLQFLLSSESPNAMREGSAATSRPGLPPVAKPSRAPAMPTILPLKEALEGPERELILQALEALNWNRQETARVLDINRTTLYKKMKKYGLLYDEPAWVN